MRKQEEQYEDLFGNTVKAGTRVMCTAYWPNQLVPMTVSHFTEYSIVLKEEGRYKNKYITVPSVSGRFIGHYVTDAEITMKGDHKRVFRKDKIKRFLVVIPDNYQIKD